MAERMLDEQTYTEKLNHPKWWAVRRIILVRDDNTCQDCGGKDQWGYVLQVHHKTYISGREPWDYPASHLITLCERCHSKIHNLEYSPTTYADMVSIQRHIKKIRVSNE